MRQFFLSLLGSIVGFFIALFLLFILLFGLIGAAIQSASPKSGAEQLAKADAAVLTLNLRGGLIDHGGEDSIFGGNAPSLITTVRALDRAKTDKKIKGLFIRANGWGMSPAKAEELSLAIEDFKSSGKFVIAHAQGFEGTSLSGYMAVSAADEIWMQKTTGVAMSGYRSEIEFLGGVFEKLDAQPQFIQFYEYKNAANSYTEKSLTDAHRESMTSMLNSIMDSSVAVITKNRGIEKQAFLGFLETAPHSAEDAKASGIVDKFGYYDDARDYAEEKAGKDASFISVSDYGTGYTKGPVIAFVGGQGAVVEGSSSSGNPFSGGGLTMGSDTLSKALIKISEDENVKAVVFRVDSPGGSAAASDQIWDAVNRVKEAGKPVVISMGQYAASGGYYVAAPADKIVAMPTTITGSIGVLGGKVAIGETLDKIGYNVEAISTGGEFSSAYSAFEPWNEANLERMREAMENIYIDFTEIVAKGRNMPIERVREIAKGRVWTGEQAKDIGLVDELGGFMKALEIAKDLAGIEKDEKVRIRVFPRPLTPAEQIESLFSASANAAMTAEQINTLTNSPEFKALMRAHASTQPKGLQLKANLPEIK